MLPVYYYSIQVCKLCNFKLCLFSSIYLEILGLGEVVKVSANIFG